MTIVRLPVVMAPAGAVFVLALAGVSCCPPQPTPIVMPCPDLVVPPRPHLPVQDYKPEWTKDQLLSANVQSVALLLGWGEACAVIIKSHNVKKPPVVR